MKPKSRPLPIPDGPVGDRIIAAAIRIVSKAKARRAKAAAGDAA